MPAKKGQASKPAQAAAAQTSRKRKAGGQKYYAVRTGHRPGVYLFWEECQKHIAGFKGCVHKSFDNREDAEAFAAGEETSEEANAEPTRFYGVAVGVAPGIYTKWPDAQLAIKGATAPKYKRFDTRADAVEYIRAYGNEAAQATLLDEEGVEPPAKKSKKTSTDTGSTVQDEPDVLQVFTDGSSLANGRKGAAAGAGVYFGKNDKRNVSERLEGEAQTNQRGELTAILRALEAVPTKQKMRIITDSQYSINCVTEWVNNWQKNGWKTKAGEVKNRDLVEKIKTLLDKREAAGTGTLFQWVKGHAASAGNIEADKLAVAGAKKVRNLS
ncbi:Uu.00g071810.m01.CDS01 [Anthostomella pinea]|uniref:Ribonuclease H n=1 Tax=Anthostomella pinea TaxID=933095 RepID=A0AAI8YNX2_9PEZI|nr:Uu.00g071810.m01.CDS01 [Anthostomella pinea]